MEFSNFTIFLQVKFTKLMKYNLEGKTVAITGSTGGIGCALCEQILSAGASIILIDRNYEKSVLFSKKLKQKFKNAQIDFVTCDLEHFENVKNATELLKSKKIDVFIHNAGAYKIDRKTTDAGFDNIFQRMILSNL